MAGPRHAVRAGPELRDALGRPGPQALRPGDDPTQHVPGTVPRNEEKDRQARQKTHRLRQGASQRPTNAIKSKQKRGQIRTVQNQFFSV